ncbi:hypothetical protein SZN_10478 [Streptomyces zinciresistens K42]|uniref:Uncharacterized protein n=1 Tax=Streptomyces zinciresistens K42 TaxID=700597 RepID=G2G9I2_9ACTN|nr:hypothetical protein [Streptomyces zinciresistens]EGX59830.1 hypothetical protein SZN_10478 [Streptomyces zinciresistens K42]
MRRTTADAAPDTAAARARDVTPCGAGQRHGTGVRPRTGMRWPTLPRRPGPGGARYARVAVLA